MSFSQLPYELQEAILADQDKSNLTSLCLVSKSFLEIARPLLYRSLNIDFFEREIEKGLFAMDRQCDRDPEDEEDAADAGEGAEEYDEPFERYFTNLLSRQVALLRTFNRHPEYTVHVKEVEIMTNVNPDQEVSELCRLLSSFSKLRRLKLSGEGFVGDLPSRTFSTLAASCPNTIRSLHLSGVFMRADDVLHFLRAYPDLLSLTLPPEYRRPPHPISTLSSNIEQLMPTAPLSLPHLKKLKITHPDSSILYAVSAAAPSLEVLDITYHVLPVLTPAAFTSIHVLVISGCWNETLVSGLLSIFKGCTSLQSLKIVEDYPQIGPNESLATALTGCHVLHHLPPTLQHLYLFSSHFEHSYLLDWMSTTAATLREITLNRFALWSWRDCSHSNSDSDSEDERGLEYGIVDYDIAKEEEVETICRRRQISLVWIILEDD